MALIVNCGFYNSKIKIGNKKIVFPTRVQESEDGAKTLILNDTSYEIGVGSRDITDKQLSVVHSICTQYSILKYANKPRIEVVVALPFNLYLNKEYRENYKRKIIGVHRGIVDGLETEVIVKDCTVFAEGAAAYLPYKFSLKNEVVEILDIGGNTINCMIYDRGDLLKDTISTLDLRMIRLERKIIDTLNIRTGWNVQGYEVKEIIERGEYKTVVDECISKHIRDIKQRLLEKKWNIDRITLFATGGGVNKYRAVRERV